MVTQNDRGLDILLQGNDQVTAIFEHLPARKSLTGKPGMVAAEMLKAWLFLFEEKVRFLYI